MSEVDKNDVQNICWKTIFIAIALLAIGAAIGHVMTMKCCPMMMGPRGGGPGTKACCDRGERECKGVWERKCRGEKEICGKEKVWFGQKADIGKCKPGCTCPKCTKKGADLSEPGKAGCPMMEKREYKPEKD